MAIGLVDPIGSFGNAGAGGISAGTIAGGLGGIYDLITGIKGTDIDCSREAAGLADPFASQRGGYQQQLSTLLKDPNSFKTDPGYKFALGQGQEAVGNASDALYGTRRNGALAPELAKYTEGYATQAYDTRIQQLMQLAGANSGSPGTAGALLQGGFDRNQTALGGGALGALAPIIQWALGKGGIPGIGGIGGPSGVPGVGGNGGVSGGNDLGEGDFRDVNDPWVHGSNDLGEGNFGDLNNPWADSPTFDFGGGDWNPDDFSWLTDVLGG